MYCHDKNFFCCSLSLYLPSFLSFLLSLIIVPSFQLVFPPFPPLVPCLYVYIFFSSFLQSSTSHWSLSTSDYYYKCESIRIWRKIMTKLIKNKKKRIRESTRKPTVWLKDISSAIMLPVHCSTLRFSGNEKRKGSDCCHSNAWPAWHGFQGVSKAARRLRCQFLLNGLAYVCPQAG